MSSVALDRDAAMALAAAGCAAAAIVLLAVDPGASRSARQVASEPVARVVASSRPLRLRAADELGWNNINSGAVVREKDSLFVPPATDARLVFQDGTTLELDERSLVVIEAPPKGSKRVALRQGSFAGVAGNNGMVVATPQGTAQVANGGQVQVSVTDGRVQLEVTHGEATLAGPGGSHTLGNGQRGELSAQGFTEAKAWVVALGAPARGQRQYFRGAPAPVDLDWSGDLPDGALVEIARDRGFAFVLQQQSAMAKKRTWSPPEAGVYWWRVVDASHQPLSEARRFSLQEDFPPSTISPRPGEVVLAPPGQPLSFVWTEVRGVSKYRVEISATADFSKVEVDRTVDRAQLKTPLELKEATWFWRVRAADEDRGDSAPSAGVGFRLIHKRILDAPELLAPEIEVTPGQPPHK